MPHFLGPYTEGLLQATPKGEDNALIARKIWEKFGSEKPLPYAKLRLRRLADLKLVQTKRLPWWNGAEVAVYWKAQAEVILHLTSGACPEQYDAVIYGEQVGYLRLRHGEFRVDYPECGGETIYRAATQDDGAFRDADERDYHLRFAVDAIHRRIAAGAPLTAPPAPNVKYKIMGTEPCG